MTTKRIVTGAHYGTRDWLGQRITAVILVLYTLYLLFSVLSVQDLNYASWFGLFLSPFMKVATLLALLSLVYHAWVGVRDIWMDYIKPAGVRLLLQLATILWLIACAAWTVQILWSV